MVSYELMSLYKGSSGVVWTDVVIQGFEWCRMD